MEKFIVVMLAAAALLSVAIVATAVEQGSLFTACLFVEFAVVAVVAAIVFARHAKGE